MQYAYFVTSFWTETLTIRYWLVYDWHLIGPSLKTSEILDREYRHRNF